MYRRYHHPVSIHASVKDATELAVLSSCFLPVSIHASVKDATGRPGSHVLRTCGFNPRICKRCDILGAGCLMYWSVSIHASVKDATQDDDKPDHRLKVSIHASVKDATFDVVYRRYHHPVSIHASVKDATSRWQRPGCSSSGFNPRICKRCDGVVAVCSISTPVSIHASVKDATKNCMSVWISCRFQSTHL